MPWCNPISTRRMSNVVTRHLMHCLLEKIRSLVKKESILRPWNGILKLEKFVKSNMVRLKYTF